MSLFSYTRVELCDAASEHYYTDEVPLVVKISQKKALRGLIFFFSSLVLSSILLIWIGMYVIFIAIEIFMAMGTWRAYKKYKNSGEVVIVISRSGIQDINKGRLPWSDIKSIHYSDAGKEGANGLMLELNSGEEVRLNFDLAIDQEEGLICAAVVHFYEKSKREEILAY